jgi:hypothetical protein
VQFQHVAKLGETKTYLLNLEQTPAATALPGGYKLFQNKLYKVKTETIDLGWPILTVKVPTVERSDLGKLRLLHLVRNELVPKGSEWKDCTVAVDNPWEPERYLAPELARYLPSYANKTISCELNDGQRPDEYFAVVLQDVPSPTRAFTELTYEIEGGERRPLGGHEAYDLTLKNSGQKSIGELNIRSMFNSRMTSMTPERGKCERSDFGFGGGTAVCYLGELPVNGKVKIHFEVTVIPQMVEPPNVFNWDVSAVIKEKPGDAVWPVNQLGFELLPEK